MKEIIHTEELTHIYMAGTPFETVALRDVTLSVAEGEILSIVGPTGCGKTTLIQHLNGILRPSRGKVYVDGQILDGTDLKKVRQRVGLVFQYPEHQLFEETVYQDIAFGPRNMGLSEEEVNLRVREAMELMELDFERFSKRSPFFLSGGEMRRVALAGVLAMRPCILAMDEPTAGLDPRGKAHLLELIKNLHRDLGVTVVMVSHGMEELYELSDRVLVMKEGRLLAGGTPAEVFCRDDLLEQAGLELPPYARLMAALSARGIPVRRDIFTLSEAKEEIKRLLGRGGGSGTFQESDSRAVCSERFRGSQP